MKFIFLLCAFFALTLLFLSLRVSGAVRADECNKDTGAALTAARTALQANNPKQDRHALKCLVQAVAALDARLQGLSEGSLAFEGQIYAPKGFAVSKPSTREGK